jgi:hypothetical protein
LNRTKLPDRACLSFLLFTESIRSAAQLVPSTVVCLEIIVRTLLKFVWLWLVPKAVFIVWLFTR